jgi:hypothetical protein
MKIGNKIMLACGLIAFGLLTTGNYFSNNTMPLNTGNVMIVIAFYIIGIMMGAIVFLPKSAFKEVITK